MDDGSREGSEARFASYVEALGVVLGHADRQQPMHDYCLGLLMPIERKSVEPMAAVTAPALGRRKASIVASFCRQRTVVGRRDAGQGGRAGAAGDRA
jgi:SRSO17 transposase